MSNESEIQRLERVYRTYRESPSKQAQWDPENPGNRAILRERNEEMEGLLRTQGLLPLSGQIALEVGCSEKRHARSVVSGLEDADTRAN